MLKNVFRTYMTGLDVVLMSVGIAGDRGQEARNLVI